MISEPSAAPSGAPPSSKRRAARAFIGRHPDGVELAAGRINRRLRRAEAKPRQHQNPCVRVKSRRWPERIPSPGSPRR